MFDWCLSQGTSFVPMVNHFSIARLSEVIPKEVSARSIIVACDWVVEQAEQFQNIFYRAERRIMDVMKAHIIQLESQQTRSGLLVVPVTLDNPLRNRDCGTHRAALMAH
ncbi:hypothetical protein CDL15_Pgr025735 [Punica granatum]|uniref:Uncharacterized protein n=1 Tax=Punica granatum TaxID=22663 RepID=A0A218WB63_PUNGR|nr:hypothetical protein CDL15_Pgr025735 [Punica granatum]